MGKYVILSLIMMAGSLFVLGLLAGCESPQALPVPPTPIPTLAPATMPPSPSLVAQAATPAPSGSVEAMSGAQTFQANCQVCHNLNEQTKVGPGLAVLLKGGNLPNGKPVSEENIAEWIHTGGGGMPPFPQIQGDQMKQLIDYLFAAARQAVGAAPAGTVTTPAVTTAPPITTTTTLPITPTLPTGSPGPSAAVMSLPGAQIFSTNCAVCHELSTQMKVGPGLAILAQPDAKLPNGKAVTDGNLAEWIRTGGGGMPGFQQLQSEQLDQLITFLKAAIKESTGVDIGAAPAGTPLTSTLAVTSPATATTAPTAPVTSATTITATLTPKGESVFNTNCSPCHNLNEQRKVGPGLANINKPGAKLPNGKPVNDENLAEWIHTGGGAMPPFPQIQGEDLQALIAYLKQAAKP